MATWPAQVFALTSPEERIPKRQAQRAGTGTCWAVGAHSRTAAIRQKRGGIAREPGGGTPRHPERLST